MACRPEDSTDRCALRIKAGKEMRVKLERCMLAHYATQKKPDEEFHSAEEA